MKKTTSRLALTTSLISSLLAQGQLADEFKDGGNAAPQITKRSEAEEKVFLDDVKVPDPFKVTLFAAPPAVNYPVYVAAAPNGDLYVSSDGNGSLGRKPHRGRILRLRDTDGDGRADEVKEFVKDVDSPRGLVWDHDRLYLIHPPDVSVYIDSDQDGVADSETTIVKGIAFGFADRPADHTTNGLTLGIDGWLYVAGGDFGFMEAVGTDGRRLQHRGGGVIRFRPDGSGLELFATGTRNILGTPVSPLLDIFARDNTNDGGGWDVRFHHFTGLEDHGYPRLYKNFSSEHIAPLADYGGGSGCGSTYLSEPGFPSEWNHAPMTCDWGTGALWRHSVESSGATFIEKAPPQKFIAMTRPTDADVDGMSAVYQASWKGATFDWAGTDSGYIVRVTPKEYTPQSLPNFETLGDPQLLSMLASESQVRSMAAQRTLVRRGKNSNIIEGLVAFASNPSQPLQARVAALYAITQIGINQKDKKPAVKAITSLEADPSLLRFVARAIGDFFDCSSSVQLEPEVGAILAKTISSSEHRTALEGMVAATRLNRSDLASNIAKKLGVGDPVLHHTAFQCLAKLEASTACFEVIDTVDASEMQRDGAFLALMRMHKAEVVAGLVKRLAQEQTLEKKKGILSTLCRLHSKEGDWKRDSWGTRPDNRGPYYQPEPWEQTSTITSVLQSHLSHASREEAAHLVAEMNRNRIQSQEALTRIIELAKSDASLIPEAVTQLASSETPPVDGIPLLIHAAKDSNSKPTTLSQTVQAIVKTDNTEAWKQVLPAMVSLSQAKGSGKEQDAAQSALMGAPKLENVHQAIEMEAEAQVGNPIGIWADAVLLNLSARKSGSPEAREMATKALETGWNNIERRIQIIRAADKIKAHTIDDKIQAAMQDPDKRVANAASSAAKNLRLKIAENDPTPKIGALAPEQALAQVLKTKGDKGLGEQIFAKATCVACHTVSQQQTQKGPYLGNIAQTYNRNDLAANILDPNRTIAQGFATNLVTLDTGATHMGFVTDESGDKLTIRDITSQEFTFPKVKITSRATLPNSMMPVGLMSGFSVREFASLLDYLESLSKK